MEGEQWKIKEKNYRRSLHECKKTIVEEVTNKQFC